MDESTHPQITRSSQEQSSFGLDFTASDILRRLDAEQTVYETYLCTFRMAGELYALDVACVGEVLMTDRIAPVPMSPPSVLGLCNMRGSALSVVELAAVLDLESSAHDAPATDISQLLVLRMGNLTVGARIDQVEGVIPLDEKDFRSTDSHGETGVISGLLHIDDARQRIASVLNAEDLESRLRAISLKQSAAS